LCSDYVVSTLEVSLLVIVKCDLNVIQDGTISTMVSAIVFLAVPVMFVGVSVCEVDVCPWLELVICMCEVGVGADERCECKLHNEVEARLMLRPQQA